MEKRFSIEEIKNYILKQDSLGDVLYYLSEDKIIEANKNEFICPDCGSDSVSEYKSGLCKDCYTWHAG